MSTWVGKGQGSPSIFPSGMEQRQGLPHCSSAFLDPSTDRQFNFLTTCVNNQEAEGDADSPGTRLLLKHCTHTNSLSCRQTYWGLGSASTCGDVGEALLPDPGPPSWVGSTQGTNVQKAPLTEWFIK